MYNSDTIIYSKNNRKRGALLGNGQVLIKPRYDELYYENNESTFSYVQKGKNGYLYANGQLKISSKQIKRGHFSLIHGYPAARFKGKYFLINSEGKKISKFYDNFILSDENVFITQNFESEKLNCIDTTGREILDKNYDFVSLNKTMLMIEDAGKRGISDYNGKIIVPLIYEDVSILGEEYITIKKDGKWGIVNKQHKKIVEPKYERIMRLRNGYIAVKKFNSGWNCLDIRNNQEILKSDYDWMDILQFNTGVYMLVKKNNKYGILNNKGEFTIPTRYKNIRYKHMYFNGEYELINVSDSEGNLKYYVDFQGNEYVVDK